MSMNTLTLLSLLVLYQMYFTLGQVLSTSICMLQKCVEGFDVSYDRSSSRRVLAEIYASSLPCSEFAHTRRR